MMHVQCRNPDWQDLANRSFIFEEGCWNQCSGYCCNFNLTEYAFCMIPHGGCSTVVMLGQEYDHWIAQGIDPAKMLSDAPASTFTFDFGGPKPLRLHFLKCTHKGNCREVPVKPLHCKLYPHLPVLGLDGALEQVLDASIFELTRSALKMPQVCHVMERRSHYRSFWEQHSDMLEPLAFPSYIFHSQAAAAFADTYLQGLAAQTGLHALQGAAFWKQWELAYLSKRLVDSEALKARIKSIHDALCRRFGSEWHF
ncbi:hypothetical protein NNJEOMEG_03345 [Fundidesulfovibrio magnetotacticus]|uniref:Uncharacterized protein n=1 Tax=Fundidesulfovibrio magnetotacticus TaxID=2730080 RepID=A0A6V8LX61_9BACT|nr:hypothetical protein [Fundidesulfovibrio magnetotacticus]GFK95480.1 hypothetical protein NNJEOMEG_03345 [Fundidesulfovibrio magnetotacticus]